MVALLDISDLRVAFRRDGREVAAVNGLSYEVGAGETLGIVGESGSGKTVTQLALLGLLPASVARVSAARASFQGRELLRLDAEARRRLRGNEIAMIFQDPMTSLNPFLRISTQLTETLAAHSSAPATGRADVAVEMLRRVGIADAESRFRAYPHELSGGMRQRVMIAMALLCKPRLLIADEPTTALDVTVQAQILDLLRGLRDDTGAAIVLITHDLGVVAGLADRVMVMYAGSMVESGSAARVFGRPAHPYTIGLLASAPRIDSAAGDELVPIPGQPPDLTALGPGCPFAPRCAHVVAKCLAAMPGITELAEGHAARCHRAGEFPERFDAVRAPGGAVR